MPGDDYAEYKDKLDLISYNNQVGVSAGPKLLLSECR